MVERAPLPPQPPPLPEPCSFDPGPATPTECVELFLESSSAPEPVLARAPITGLRPLARAASRLSLVRLSARGVLFAARGRGVSRLSNAAVFLHGLAGQISADLGQSGPVDVHLYGRGKSLSVVRSEVGDIAAAYGSMRRVASVLRKVGIR